MTNFVKHSVVFVFLLIIAGCSVKKDNFTNRFYHKSTAWFNILFNGEESLKKELKNTEKNFQEDYGGLLPVLPGQLVPQLEDEDYEYSSIESKKPDVINDLTSIFGRGNSNSQEDSEDSGNPYEYAEKKAIKAIENHSMIIRSTERNKLMANAYLLLGKARYYQGKSYEALDAFNYISQNIKGSKKTREAQFWVAKTNFQARNRFYALEELVKLYEQKDLKKGLKEEIAALYSQVLIDEGKYQTAIEALEKTKQNTKNRKRKGRYTFIQAQLQNQLGNYLESSKLFDQVKKYHPGFEMEFQAKMGIAQNFVSGKNNYDAFQKEFGKMLKDSKYEEYKDQIYYHKGLIAERSKKSDDAEKLYKKGLLESSSSERIKSLTYAHIGNILFDKESYIASGNYYDSAVTVSENEQIKAFLGTRKEHLKELIENYKKVKHNDSILKIAKMTPVEQEAYFQKYVDQLKKEDSQKKEKLEKSLDDFESLNRTSAFDNSYENKKNFYFYNDNLRVKGQQEFKKRWGDRQLSDNWRISSVASKIQTDETQPEEVVLDETQRYNVHTYLAQIPSDKQVLHKMKEERDSAQFNMGLVYLDKIKNNEKAVITLENLITNNPKEDLKVKAYFNLFKALESHPKEADKYKNILISQYSGTSYAEYALNPQAENFVTGNSEESVKMYEQAFEAYESEDWDTYKQLANDAVSKYGKEEIIAKFSLLNAFVEGKTKGKEAMETALNNVILVYPELPEGKKAKELIRLIESEKTNIPDTIKKPDTEEKSFNKVEVNQEKGEIENIPPGFLNKN
ncbi:MAG: tetratricopeptide repeat protein [Flavobacteriales bacterium]